MLDLQAGVHFQEEEALVLAGHKLDRAGRVIVHGLGQRDGLGAHGGAGGLVEQGRRRLLDDLLIAPLDRAFALEQVDDIAVLVAQHLDLDVARALDELLDEDPVVAEAGLGFRLHRREALFHVLPVPGDPDALAAAAGRGLDHHRIADVLTDLDSVGGVVDLAHMARHHRDIGLGRELLGLDLVAHRLDGVRVRADEDDALGGQPLGEAGVPRQESEAWVNGLGAGLAAGVDDLVGRQIALGGGRGTDEYGLVGHFDRHGIGVSLGIDHHGGDPQPAAGLDDADRDLAAVGDQDFGEHGPRLGLYRGRPGSAIMMVTSDQALSYLGAEP
ncbi:hypothetical protein GALL_519010 [mine drainage metagenome]|uniref:NAD-specific glutamate dehydrogenase n=1 Tax=mine drainage metagenome TaxID=410659 RepID=A0A1J5PFC8_9ZZZZ